MIALRILAVGHKDLSRCKFKVESNPGVDERGGAVEGNRGRFTGSEIRPIELAVIQDLISAIQDLPRDNQRVEKLGARVRHIGAPREGACNWCDFRAICGPLEDRRLLAILGLTGFPPADPR